LAASRQKRRSGRRYASSPGRSRLSATALAVLALLVCGALAYGNSFAGILVFDDEPAIAENQHIRQLWPLTDAKSAPDGSTLDGRPVASLSFALNYAAAQGDPREAANLWGYHLVNLGIHLLASLLLFAVARRTLASPRLRERFGAHATPLSFAIALLWTVHPLQTGSVTYIVQRVESLMGLFYLATLYCSIRALEARWRSRWTAAAIVVCALGMGTKEVMATAPLMVALWDWLFADQAKDAGRRPQPATERSRTALYGGLAATWIVLGVLLAGQPRVASVGFGFAGWPWWSYLLTQAEVIVHYLRLAIVPSPLVLDYGWPAVPSVADVAPELGLLTGLVVLTLWGVVRRAPAAFLGAWLFLILAPTSSVLPIVTEVAAEHRMYLPLAAVIGLVVIGAYLIITRATGAGASRLLARFAVLALAAVTVVLIVWTRDRNEAYHDYDRIWRETIARRPANPRARNNYATSLIARGSFAEAETHLRHALSIDPSFAEALANLGIALSSQGRFEEGIPLLERAVALDPRPASYRNLGEAHGARGDTRRALASFSQGLALSPDDVALMNRAAWILATDPDAVVRDGARARQLAARAVSLTNERDVTSLDSLAAAHAELGEFDLAIARGRHALERARTSEPAMVPELESPATSATCNRSRARSARRPTRSPRLRPISPRWCSTRLAKPSSARSRSTAWTGARSTSATRSGAWPAARRTAMRCRSPRRRKTYCG
jgi:tetratricopeptide (TPR) repeat protein